MSVSVCKPLAVRYKSYTMPNMVCIWSRKNSGASNTAQRTVVRIDVDVCWTLYVS